MPTRRTLVSGIGAAALTGAAPAQAKADTFTPMDGKTLRGAPGFFRVGRDKQGVWWFADPQGRPFFFRGVTSIASDGWGTKRPDGTSYDKFIKFKYGEDLSAYRAATIARLKSWGFNGIGGFAGAEFFDNGFPYTITLNFSKLEGVPRIDGTFLPDAFDPTWHRLMDAEAARVCLPRKQSRDLIGYFTDNELSWAQAATEDRPALFDPSQNTLRPKNRPSLLQLCLSLPPDRSAHKAAWEWVGKRHGDKAALARAWAAPLLVETDAPERLRDLTLAQTALYSPGYVADDTAWGRVFAEAYFQRCAEIIRKNDPNHLILGCRFGGPPGQGVLSAMRPAWVDVVSANNYRDTFYERMDIYAKGTGLPVLNGEFAWVTDYFLKQPLPNEPIGGLAPTERMLLKGRAALERAFTHPALVGYAWYRWVDKADFVPPISYGLVSVTDEPNFTHLGTLQQIHARSEQIHATGKA